MTNSLRHAGHFVGKILKAISAFAPSSSVQMSQLNKSQEKTGNFNFVIDGAKLTRLHEVAKDPSDRCHLQALARAMDLLT
jgi:hypothetical protein